MFLFKIPNELFSVTQFLRNLDLSNNKIKQMPPLMFTQMQLLKTLILNNNRIGMQVANVHKILETFYLFII